MKQEEYKAWLDSLKVGDEVAFDFGGRWYREQWNVLSVCRRTRTQIIADGYRFSAKTGKMIGDNDRKDIQPVSGKILQAIRRNKAERKFNNLIQYPSKYTTEQLEAVIAILEEKGND